MNGSKSSCVKHQGSPQVTVPSEKVISGVMRELESREDQLAVFLTTGHHPATCGLVECTGTNAERFANCRQHHQIVPKVGSVYSAVRHVPCRESE
jgi:hypothetical protein